MPEWLKQWQNGIEAAFHEASALLWQRLYKIGYFYLIKLGADKDLAADLAHDAFWDTLEELDLMISGGRLLTEPLAEPGQEDKVRGRVSGRILGKRPPPEWRGMVKFVALVRRIFILRCLDRYSRWNPYPVEVVSEEDLPGNLPTPEQWILDQEELVRFMGHLARASEQLGGRRACRELVEATLVYIKKQVAQCHPMWKDRSLDDIAVTPIEELLVGADLGAFIVTGGEWRQFLMEVLDLSRDALDQRIGRCLQVLRPLFVGFLEDPSEDGEPLNA